MLSIVLKRESFIKNKLYLMKHAGKTLRCVISSGKQFIFFLIKGERSRIANDVCVILSNENKGTPIGEEIRHSGSMCRYVNFYLMLCITFSSHISL